MAGGGAAARGRGRGRWQGTPSPHGNLPQKRPGAGAAPGGPSQVGEGGAGEPPPCHRSLPNWSAACSRPPSRRLPRGGLLPGSCMAPSRCAASQPKPERRGVRAWRELLVHSWCPARFPSRAAGAVRVPRRTLPGSEPPGCGAGGRWSQPGGLDGSPSLERRCLRQRLVESLQPPSRSCCNRGPRRSGPRCRLRGSQAG